MPTERQLAEELGVSRPTIREAMIALEISGFVENRFGAGAFVSTAPPCSNQLTSITDPGPFELIEARMLIEGEVASIAAQNIRPCEIEHLKKCVDQMRLEESGTFWSADEEFHVTIAAATRNTAFTNIVREFWRQRNRMPMWVSMYHGISVEVFRETTVSEHEGIVKALESNDPDASRAAMRAHISSFGRQLLEKWGALDEDLRADVDPPGERLMRQLT